MTEPKYPDVRVELIGQDGNVFSVLGRVCVATRKAGVSKPEIDAFMSEATGSGSYDGVLRTCMKWVEVEGTMRLRMGLMPLVPLVLVAVAVVARPHWPRRGRGWAAWYGDALWFALVWTAKIVLAVILSAGLIASLWMM